MKVQQCGSFLTLYIKIKLEGIVSRMRGHEITSNKNVYRGCLLA